MRIARILSVFLLFGAICCASDGTPSPRSWELLASTGAENNYFGYSIAVSGNTLVVGNLTGQVYVYEKPASGWGNMVQTAELTSSEGLSFGPYVAISGDTVVVGSNTPNGQAYVFVKPAGGWANMNQTAILSDGLSGDYFGTGVAIDGNTIVVGAPGGTEFQGAAYVFEEPPTGWANTSWANAVLTSSNDTYLDLFGAFIAFNGNTIAIGAPYNGDQTGPGAVYVYVKAEAGWTSMTQTAELTESVQGLYDSFGATLGISGSTIVAGAPQAGADNTGAAYLFVEPSGGWTNMTETTQLLSSNTHPGFGNAVAIVGAQAVIAEDGNLTYRNPAQVYTEPPGGWQQTATPSVLLNSGQLLSHFGYSIGIGEGVVFVGAPYQTVRGNSDEGSVFGFQLTQP